MEEKYLCFRKKVGTNFPGCPNSMDFAVLSHAKRNWCGNPCISHTMNFTTGCESNEKNHSHYEKSMSTSGFVGFFREQFPSLFPFDGFSCLFPCFGKLMRKPMHFPYDGLYHRMEI